MFEATKIQKWWSQARPDILEDFSTTKNEDGKDYGFWRLELIYGETLHS